MPEKPIDITLKLAASIKEDLGVYPTAEQSDLIVSLAEFIKSDNSDAFVLRGYAGTGKSTVVGAVVKSLKKYGIHSVLLAPTGRAAKVLSAYSRKPAFTIHKKIYFRGMTRAGYSEFKLAPNVHSRTLFVVDEASMISDVIPGKPMFGRDSLLNDLLKYVRSGRSCKLLLVGDTAQLPPVDFDDSPALEPNLLAARGFRTSWFELTKVVRQEAASGILANATAIRQEIGVEAPLVPKINPDFPDIHRVIGHELQDALESNIGSAGDRGTVVITRSNKRALQFNKEIRARVFWYESRIVEGELLMIVKNNYFWSNSEEIGFIANGDIVEIVRINGYVDRYGFSFAEVTLGFVDYPGNPELDTLILLDSLEQPHPSMPREEMKKLWNNVLLDYQDEKNMGRRRKKAMTNPYMNALVVKYAYAITCHKAQGGQWPTIFIDHGYLTEEMMGNSFLRWLYTAITRATDQVYLINFHRSFFEEEAY